MLDHGADVPQLQSEMIASENKIRELKGKLREQGDIYSASKVTYIRDDSKDNKAKREIERGKFASIKSMIDEEKVSLSIIKELLKAEKY